MKGAARPHPAPTGAPIDYLKPDLPAHLRLVEMPVVDATDADLQAYGHLVQDPDLCKVEIVRWPAPGWRPAGARLAPG